MSSNPSVQVVRNKWLILNIGFFLMIYRKNCIRYLICIKVCRMETIGMIDLLTSKPNQLKGLNKMIAIQPIQKVRHLNNARGFSLIELLIAMGLILIMAAIAVPNYLAALSRANEASASSSVRAVISAENLYRNTYGTFTTLQDLGSEVLDRLAPGEWKKEWLQVQCNSRFR